MTGVRVQRVAMPYGDAESWTVVDKEWQPVRDRTTRPPDPGDGTSQSPTFLSRIRSREAPANSTDRHGIVTMLCCVPIEEFGVTQLDHKPAV